MAFICNCMPELDWLIYHSKQVACMHLRSHAVICQELRRRARVGHLRSQPVQLTESQPSILHVLQGRRFGQPYRYRFNI